MGHATAENRQQCHEYDKISDVKLEQMSDRVANTGGQSKFTLDCVKITFKLIDWMMELPDTLADEFWKELKQYEEKERMPFITTPERYGRAEGCLEGIEAVLEVRFQDAGLQLMPEIRLIHDAETLEKILHAAITVASPEELRKLWAGEAAG